MKEGAVCSIFENLSKIVKFVTYEINIGLILERMVESDDIVVHETFVDLNLVQ